MEQLISPRYSSGYCSESDHTHVRKLRRFSQNPWRHRHPEGQLENVKRGIRFVTWCAIDLFEQLLTFWGYFSLAREDQNCEPLSLLGLKPLNETQHSQGSAAAGYRRRRMESSLLMAKRRCGNWCKSKREHLSRIAKTRRISRQAFSDAMLLLSPELYDKPISLELIDEEKTN